MTVHLDRPVTALPMHVGSLEELLGDPYDAANPTGHDAILAADDRAEPLAAGEDVLDAWSANAHFVPEALGGRLAGVDELVRRLRPVFRRDAGLGLGHGLTSLMAALPVWVAGGGAQQRAVAGLLLGGEKLAVAFHELAHGNDLTRNALRAVPGAAGGFTVDGAKQVINNAERARGALVFARTGTAAGREHSLLLLEDLDALPPDRFARLSRFRTAGLPGCRLAGLRFDGCPVGQDALVGDLGAGGPTALRAFQVSRCVTAGAGTAMLEGALFATLRFASRRRLYGRTVADLPHTRSLLAGAFGDLQVAQVMVRTAARALHLHPAAAGRYAAATKYLVPVLVEAALGDLAVVLGARSYLREGEYAIVGKHLRDVGGLSIGHAGGVSCQLTVLPELPGLDLACPQASEALFDDSPLPALDLGALRLRGSRADPVLAALDPATADVERGGDAAIRELVQGVRAELAAFRTTAAGLPARERGVTAGPRALRLVDRYAWSLAAAGCLGMHHEGRRTGGFPGSPAWLRTTLQRIGLRSGRLGMPPTEPDDAVFAELTARAAAGCSFDLDPEPVVRGPL